MTPACAAPPPASRGGGGRGGPPAGPRGHVVSIAAARIQAALDRRARYRYVKPRVVPEGAGWRIVSPNCSRSVDAQGGDIDIAWFEPLPGGRWLVHAREHALQAWRAWLGAASLADALAIVCADVDRVFWP